MLFWAVLLKPSMSNIVTDPQNSYRSAAGKRVGNEILDMFDGPVGMLALFLLSQATEKTSMTSTASNRKISSNNVVGSQRKTLPEIKAGVSITYCEVFGSSRRRSIAQVMNYQSGHSGRNYWNLFQILITMPKTTTFQKNYTLWCWRCYCDACWELCFWFNSFEEHQNKLICTPIVHHMLITNFEFCINTFFMNFALFFYQRRYLPGM